MMTAIAFFVIAMMFTGLMKTQDEKYKKKREEDRQKNVLNEALRSYGNRKD